jgi:hypothetical protein
VPGKKESVQVFAEIKKPDIKAFFDYVQDAEEQDCIQDKADNEPYPSAQPGHRDNRI